MTKAISEQRPTRTTEVLNRIAVAPPYFALTDVVDLGCGLVAATVPVEPVPAPEGDVVQAAQVARHLAILGSCAAALGRGDDTRHHYLATRAHYMRLSGGPERLDGIERLEAQALATWVDKRTVRASVKLIAPAGTGLHVLDVEYSVLSERMFGRLHPPLDDFDLEAAERPVVPGEIVRTDSGFQLEAGPIPASSCAGHFPSHPAAPVAIVMGRLCRLAGMCAIDRAGDPKATYRIEQGFVEAARLASAGQNLRLRADYVGPVDGGHQLTGLATADGEEVGRVNVTMSLRPAAAPASATGG